MTKLTLLLALAATLGATGCKHGSGAATAGSDATGSARSGSAPAMASPGSAGSAEPAALSNDAREEKYLECWDDFDAGKWDAYRACYAADATYTMPGSTVAAKGADAIVAHAKTLRAAFPDLKGKFQLVLVDGHRIAAFALVNGVNAGPFDTPAGQVQAPTRKIGFYVGQLLEMDDRGQITREQDYVDLATLLGQLAPDKAHPVRPVEHELALPASAAEAQHDGKEQANLATDKKLVAAFDAHDAKAFGALLDDHYVSSENAAPRDTNKAESIAVTRALWKSFSDVKLDIAQQWAAGDFVVTSGTMDGTNTGPVPGMKIAKATGKKISVPYLELDEVENGKVLHAWLFDSSITAEQQLGVSRAKKK